MTMATQGLGIGGATATEYTQEVTGQVEETQPVTGTVTTDTITGEVN